MFRLLKLKPPHGWNAVAWELGIVTLGVLIALAAQQWAENRSWDAKVKAGKEAIRGELAEHYGYAIEFRVVYPCLQAQLDRLRERVLKSGATLDPAPVFSEPGYDYALRMPWKFYPSDAWQEAIGDGIVQRFDPAMRRQLAGHYVSLVTVATLNAANTEAEPALMALAYPLPLDGSTRYTIVRDIEQLRGRLQFLDTTNGQVIDYIAHVGMIPAAREAQKNTERYGTYRFCKAHGLPMRPLKEAMVAVPN